MKTLQQGLLIAMMLLLTVFVAACGGTGGNQGNGGTAAKQENNKDTGKMNNGENKGGGMGYGNNGGMQPTQPPQQGGNMDAFIHTAQANLDGNTVDVLTTKDGFMLYYYQNDAMNVSNCTGGCAAEWSPLIAPDGMMNVSSQMQLTGQLAVVKTANGQQVAYNGHPLYTYKQDTAAGQFNGRGVGGVWYLVSTTIDPLTM